MIVSIIVAVSENNVIGKDNDLIWHLPADMKYFKETTMGHCILTGRKNYESIPEKYRPLSGRTNIVLTRNSSLEFKGVVVKGSIKEGIEYAKSQGESELFIIGGGEVYKQSFKFVNRIYLTSVHQDFEGDTYFPEFSLKEWEVVSSEFKKADEKNPYDMTFQLLEKR